MTYITERRKRNRCPECESEFIEIVLDPLPAAGKHSLRCISCGHTFPARRYDDVKEFHEQAKEYA